MSNRPDRKNIPPVAVDEERILSHVQDHLAAKRPGSGPGVINYDEELISLRDAISEARPEDIPPLVEQMTRVQSLAAQRGMGDDLPVDPTSPYFGHLRLKEDEGERDVLLGKRTYLSKEDDIRIVDWRNAPVSKMYYSYDEDDDYEETFGGRRRRGLIAVRRSVTIQDKTLCRIAAPQGLFVKRKAGEWLKLDPRRARLSGGQGSSIRAERLKPVRGTLGVDSDGIDRRDKHLPEIAALLDKSQFGLISSGASGLVVVQGGAGSGKTTVGLHRIAYLAYQDPQRFRPRHMLVVVFNEALANYIGRVLPALGVAGVPVATFIQWARELRKKHIRGLPNHHSDTTPSVVSRLKKHPALLSILDDRIDRLDEALTGLLFKGVAGSPDEDRVRTAWKTLQRMPIEARQRRFADWLAQSARIGPDKGRDLHPRTVVAAESALKKMARVTGEVVTDWAELFTDQQALKEAFDLHAPAEFSESELGEVHAWCVLQYARLEEDSAEDPPVLDEEDEAILLRLHQLKRGWLKGKRGRLAYDHLMIDEAQDFSPIELAVLMETLGPGRPVTIAGDTAQKIVRESGFVSWEQLLDDLGLEGSRVAPLKIAYRSTVEIMRFSHDVLGPCVGDKPNAYRHGAPVELHRFSDPGQAVGFLAKALRDLAGREPLANVAIIARHPEQARLYHDGLTHAEIPKLNLVLDEDFSFEPGVEVTEIHQVKGLEFDYVVLVEVNADSYPDSEEARHLLHVGATRAAHQLWVFTTGTCSPILPPWLVAEE